MSSLVIVISLWTICCGWTSLTQSIFSQLVTMAAQARPSRSPRVTSLEMTPSLSSGPEL
jgi:hypothetical protein